MIPTPTAHRPCPYCDSKAFAPTTTYERCFECGYAVEFSPSPYLNSDGGSIAADSEETDPLEFDPDLAAS